MHGTMNIKYNEVSRMKTVKILKNDSCHMEVIRHLFRRPRNGTVKPKLKRTEANE